MQKNLSNSSFLNQTDFKKKINFSTEDIMSVQCYNKYRVFQTGQRSMQIFLSNGSFLYQTVWK